MALKILYPIFTRLSLFREVIEYSIAHLNPEVATIDCDRFPNAQFLETIAEDIVFAVLSSESEDFAWDAMLTQPSTYGFGTFSTF
jgi:hypothetical protein